MLSTLQNFSDASEGVRSSLYFWSLLGGIVLVIAIVVHQWKKQPQEPFTEDVDDLQGSKNLGVKIQGVRQLQIEPGGIRFTPNGSTTQQSLLQHFFVDTVNVGNWVLAGGVTISSGTFLSSSVQIQRIGKLVTVQVTSLGPVIFGTNPARSVKSISSTVGIPASLRPQTAISVMVIDDTKRSDTRSICEAILGTDGKITIQRYNRSSTIAGNRATMSLASFVFQYLLA